METARAIRKVFRSRPTIEGAGVHLKRAFGFSEVPLFDPFLLLDDFRSDDPARYRPGFPWHPHRGIETITYVLRGDVEHGDSLGHRGVITSGDVQWMTAGSGIIHQEMPKGDPLGSMWGFQLWANLPAGQKMMDPRYRDVRADQIPTVTLSGGVEVRVICGRVGDAQGPVRDIVTDPVYVDVSLPPGSTYVHPTTAGHTVFAYVTGGRGYFCEERRPFAYEAQGANYFDMERDPRLGDGTLVLFGDGGRIVASTEADPLRFLLVSGRPLGEPIAWYGPIVMNTQEELELAFAEYRAGNFTRHRAG
ncbi:MAG: pirin family protein [Deltaproteobacteria bacterium]|nr:pirin family protein [Deltaproteobacteria bacterium]